MKQPNLGYADVKLNFACMHPAGCACRVSLSDYYNLCGWDERMILDLKWDDQEKLLGWIESWGYLN